MKLYVDKPGETFTIHYLQQVAGSFEFDVAGEYVNQIELGLNSINYAATTSENLVFTTDPTTIHVVDTIYKDSNTGNILYTIPGGVDGTIQEGGPDLPIFLQAHHNADQTFGDASTPQTLLLNTITSSNGMSIDSNQDISIDSIDDAGDYVIHVKAQAATSSGLNREVEVWLEKDSVGIDCTTSHTVLDQTDGALVPIHFIVNMTNETIINIRGQVSNTNAFLDFQAASGGVPCTPSLIISMYKLN